MASVFNPDIARAHRAALRSINRVVTDTATPMEDGAARAGVVGLFRSGGVLVLTGAGVSTDSGIPDYRGPGGRHGRHRPMTYQEFRHDIRASHRYWARSFVGWRVMASAAPNRAHFSLAELERAGLVDALITQNVDGLHLAAGSTRVLPLHGDLSRVLCLNCGFVEDRREFDRRLESANPGFVDAVRLDPRVLNPDGDVFLDPEQVARFRMVGCVRCASTLLKPDVTYFGEPVSSISRARSLELLGRASSLVVIGSSLAVMSGYRLVIEAQRAGKPVAVVNGGPGRADARAEIVWRTRIGPAMDAILDGLDL
ncbi:Sir2 family NAD-dependent protein deacetylase [Corynebacterium pacaense]|uniref:Sir2 family NAD-dependent protein deacetylase n=1 Tax=Corynebacterium pacaense TaxID=1816684 RepID=UPI0009BA9674|nr:Sir2 family NAD-dependent protein deacetylase [Corynebacterium pacaense]